MARIDYWQYLVDRQGRPLQDADVRVYLAGTVIEADIYLNATFGSPTKASIYGLKTNKYGFIQFWVGDEFEVEGGYVVDQQFKIVWQNTVDVISETIDDLYVFTPVRQIEILDLDKTLDKVISNKQGHKWDSHVDSIVPSASPHDLEPVVWFDLYGKQNKVISNKLGYQMYEMSETASITPIDISAARLHHEDITSWTTSGGKYYKDIIHNFDNYYTIVKVAKLNSNYQIIPEKVESISPDITRVWLSDGISVSIGVFG